MPRPLLILVALVAAVALFSVRLMPPTLVDDRLSAMTKGAVHVIDAEGTLWNARGVLAAGSTRIPVAWRIEPWPLVRRELRLHLLRGEAASAATPKGEIAIGRNALELRDVDATIPAAFIGAATGSQTASLVGGDIRIDAALLDWAPPANRGEARIRWLGAWLTAPGNVEPIALGDITATLSGAGDRLSGPVSNAGGDLAVAGNVALSAGSGVQLSLVLTPRRANDRELAHALSLLGTPEGNGWRVDWRLPMQ